MYLYLLSTLGQLFLGNFKCNISLWNIRILIIKIHIMEAEYKRNYFIVVVSCTFKYNVHLYLTIINDTGVYYCIIYYDVDKIIFPKKLVSGWSLLLVGYIFSRSASTIYNQSLYDLHPRGISNILYVDTHITRYTHIISRY